MLMQTASRTSSASSSASTGSSSRFSTASASILSSADREWLLALDRKMSVLRRILQPSVGSIHRRRGNSSRQFSLQIVLHRRSLCQPVSGYASTNTQARRERSRSRRRCRLARVCSTPTRTSGSPRMSLCPDYPLPVRTTAIVEASGPWASPTLPRRIVFAANPATTLMSTAATAAPASTSVSAPDRFRTPCPSQCRFRAAAHATFHLPMPIATWRWTIVIAIASPFHVHNRVRSSLVPSTCHRSSLSQTHAKVSDPVGDDNGPQGAVMALAMDSAPSSGFFGGLDAFFMNQQKVARDKKRSLLKFTTAFASRTLTVGASPTKSELVYKLPNHI